MSTGSDHSSTPLSEHGGGSVIARTLAQLASELGHDINNQLAVILNCSYVLRRRMTPSSPACEALDEMDAAAWRASRLIEGVRAVSRPRLVPGDFDLSAIVTAMMPLLEEIAGDCPLQLILARGLPLVRGPAAQLELVTLALLAHMHRTAEPGTLLKVETLHGQGDAPRLSIRNEPRDCGELGRAASQPPRSSLIRPRGLGGHAQLLRALRLTGGRIHRHPHRIDVDFHAR